MEDPRKILLRILDIIGYSEDKEKFATEFLQNVSTQSLLDLITSLPQDKQEEIKQKISTLQNDPKATGDMIKTYFTEQQIENALQNSSKNAVIEYIKAIANTLSEEQKANLINYSQELNQNSSPVQLI